MMARSNYNRALKAVLVHEGGKVDHPKDPGGRTNQGVIQRVYDGYRRRKGLKPRDVWLMTAKERDEIYRIQYWNAIRGDDLPAGLDYVVFDGAVNSGPMQSVKWLQRALGVQVDGLIGEATLAAIQNHPDHVAIINSICDRRLNFLKALKTWPTFGKGWSRRVAEVRKLGINMTSGLVESPSIIPDEFSSAKATIKDAREAPQTATADLAAGGGSVGTPVLAAQVDTAKNALEPLTGTSQWIDAIFTGLVIVGTCITVAGIIWALWARKKRRELADALDLNTVPA